MDGGGRGGRRAKVEGAGRGVEMENGLKVSLKKNNKRVAGITSALRMGSASLLNSIVEITPLAGIQVRNS